MTITEVAQLAPLLTSIAACLAAVGSVTAVAVAFCGMRISQRNSHKIDAGAVKLEQVRKTTNGLSERNEILARHLGIAEGKATEKANPT
jgi:hypothetical protein